MWYQIASASVKPSYDAKPSLERPWMGVIVLIDASRYEAALLTHSGTNFTNYSSYANCAPVSPVYLAHTTKVEDHVLPRTKFNSAVPMKQPHRWTLEICCLPTRSVRDFRLYTRHWFDSVQRFLLSVVLCLFIAAGRT